MLHEPDTAWLTTLRPDGSPHSTPVWFVRVDEGLWFSSPARSRKVLHLLGDPRMSLCLDATADHPQVAEGTVVVHEDPLARPDVLDALAAKYSGWNAADPTEHGPRVLVEITVARWLLGGP